MARDLKLEEKKVLRQTCHFLLKRLRQSASITAFKSTVQPFLQILEPLVAYRGGSNEASYLLQCVQAILLDSRFHTITEVRANIVSMVHFLLMDTLPREYLGGRGLNLPKLQYADADTDIQLLFDNTRCSKSKMVTRIGLIEFVKTVSKECFGEVELSEYGAGVNSFCFNSSDIDLSINFANLDEKDEVNYLNALKLEFNKPQNMRLYPMGYKMASNCVHLGTKPVLNLEFVHTNQVRESIQLDISCKNEVPLINSRFLSCYKHFGETVYVFCTLVKLWAHVRGIDKASKGYISSFFWLVIAIFFLQQQDEPIVINLLNPQEKLKPYLKKHSNPVPILEYYELQTPLSVTKELSKQQNEPVNSILEYLSNSDSIVVLLWKFFKFFMFEFDRFKYVVSLRYVPEEGQSRFLLKSDLLNTLENSRKRKRDSEKQSSVQYASDLRLRTSSLLCIEDPFREGIISFAQGKMELAKIMAEFERGCGILLNNEPLTKIFEPENV